MRLMHAHADVHFLISLPHACAFVCVCAAATRMSSHFFYNDMHAILFSKMTKSCVRFCYSLHCHTTNRYAFSVVGEFAFDTCLEI